MDHLRRHIKLIRYFVKISSIVRHGYHLIHRGEKLGSERPAGSLPFSMMQVVDYRTSWLAENDRIAHGSTKREVIRQDGPVFV